MANVGYCGLDRRRAPLDGEEIRACWDGIAPLPVEASGTTSEAPATPVRLPPGFSLFADFD